MTKFVLKVIIANRAKIGPCLVNSPDLDPIKNVWCYAKGRVKAEQKMTNISQFRGIV